MSSPAMNVLFRIHRISFSDDDEYGGAVQTGTVVGDFYGSFSEPSPNRKFLEQGIEVERIANVLLRVHGGCGQNEKSVAEGDQLEIIRPPSHPYLNKRFTVNAVSYTPFHPAQRRSLVELTCRRTDWDRKETEVD